MIVLKLVVAGLVFAAIISVGVGVVVLLTHWAMNALDYGGEDE